MGNKGAPSRVRGLPPLRLGSLRQAPVDTQTRPQASPAAARGTASTSTGWPEAHLDRTRQPRGGARPVDPAVNLELDQ